MKVKIIKAPPQNGLSVEGGKYNTLSTDGINLLGDYHHSGGTMVSSNGELVEAEKNEPIYTGSDGSNYVFGNVVNPFTNKKFKAEGKELLTEKGKFEKKLGKANDVVSEADPRDTFGSLDFNTGKVQMDAAQININNLKEKLDGLASTQESLLSMAEQTGMDPKDLGKNMKKNGGKIKVRMTGVPQAKNGTTLPSWLDNLSNPSPVQFPWNTPAPQTPQQAAQSQSPVQPAQPMPIQPNPADAEVTNWLQNSPDVWGNPGFIPPQVRDNTQGSLAQRNNNPGNLRFNSQSGAVKGDAGFAKFNSYEDGFKALTNDIKAKQTGKTRTGLGPNSTIQDLMNVYSPAADSNDPVRLANTLAQGLGVPVNTPIGQLDTQKLAKLISINEDAAYSRSKGITPNNVTPLQSSYAPPPIATPIYNDPATPEQAAQNWGFQPTDMTQARQFDPRNAIDDSNQVPNYVNPQSTPRPLAGGQRPKNNSLNPLNYLGEISAILDRPDYVQGQQFDPTLMSPYRVSFQDQISQNTADYNALARTLGNNPEALATLAGQKYQQDQGVLGNEFRTNQGIQNQVLNQNNQILNQAQLTNNQYADQQYQRQAEAKGITDTNRQNALNSISNKVQQNTLYNNERQAQYDSQQRLSNMYGNLYQNYSFDPNGNVIFNDNGGYNFNYGGFGGGDSASYYRYLAQQKQQKKQAEKDAAASVSQKAFGYKFK